MVKGAVELSEHDFGYQPRTAIKAQVLTDFIADGVSFGQPEFEWVKEAGIKPVEGK